MLRQVVVAVVAAITTLPAAAQTLWGNTRAGMTVAEVTAAVPDAQLQRGPNGEEFMTAPTLDLADGRFEPGLFFKDGKLEKVALAAKGLTPQNNDRVYDQLVTALRSKYGTEVQRRVETSSIAHTRELTWASGGTTVNLFNMIIGDRSAVMQVRYTNTVGRDASKL